MLWVLFFFFSVPLAVLALTWWTESTTVGEMVSRKICDVVERYFNDDDTASPER